MSKALIGLGVVVGLVAILVFTVMGTYNGGVRTENTFIAKHDSIKNVYAQYTQKVLEASQVPAMQRDDLTKVIEAALRARYGQEGSKAVFQWIQEQNPTIDSAVYTKIQQIIESGRTDFANAQDGFIDVKRAYKTKLETMPGGFILGVLGFPRVNLDEYKIVLTERTEESFKNGKEDGPLQLR